MAGNCWKFFVTRKNRTLDEFVRFCSLSARLKMLKQGGKGGSILSKSVYFNTISTPVLMHFLFLYFRFFITYFPFFNKKFSFPSKLSFAAFFHRRKVESETSKDRKREIFCYLLKTLKGEERSERTSVDACNGSKWSNFLFMQQFYGL